MAIFSVRLPNGPWDYIISFFQCIVEQPWTVKHVTDLGVSLLLCQKPVLTLNLLPKQNSYGKPSQKPMRKPLVFIFPHGENYPNWESTVFYQVGKGTWECKITTCIVHFGEIQGYGRQPSLLGFRKEPQDVVASLPSIQPRLAKCIYTAFFNGLLFKESVFAYLSSENLGFILIC